MIIKIIEGDNIGDIEKRAQALLDAGFFVHQGGLTDVQTPTGRRLSLIMLKNNFNERESLKEETPA